MALVALISSGYHTTRQKIIKTDIVHVTMAKHSSLRLVLQFYSFVNDVHIYDE